MSILPQEFWDVLKGKNPPSDSSKTSCFLPYTNLVEGKRGYTDTIMKKGYTINLLVVKNAFYISVALLSDISRPIGTIYYQKPSNKRKRQNTWFEKHEMQYFQKKIKKDNPIAKEILFDIKYELEQKKIWINERARTSGGRLPLERPIKIIICSLLWEKFSTLTPVQKAEKISILLDAKPSTTAGTYGASSPNPNVKREAFQAFNKINERQHDITGEWHKIRNKLKNIGSIMIVRIMARRKKISPTTVATYARFSKDKDIKREGNKVLCRLADNKNLITFSWRALSSDNPNLTSEEIVMHISEELNLNPSSICTYVRESRNRDIQTEAYKLLRQISSKKKNYCIRILTKHKKNPSRSFLEIITQIGKRERIALTSICIHSQMCNDSWVKKQSHVTYKKLCEQKHELSKAWVMARQENPNLSPLEIVEIISKEKGLKPKTIIDYCSYSSEKSVKFESSIAISQLKKRGIFSDEFILKFRNVISSINTLIDSGIRETPITYLRDKNYGFEWKCLRILKNYGKIKIINSKDSKDASKIYYLPRKKINAMEFIDNFVSDKNYQDKLKGIF